MLAQLRDAEQADIDKKSDLDEVEKEKESGNERGTNDTKVNP